MTLKKITEQKIKDIIYLLRIDVKTINSLKNGSNSIINYLKTEK